MKRLNEIRNQITATKPRGAWAAGVKLYALDILDTIEERSDYEGHEPENLQELKEYALNGAKDYRHPQSLYKAWSVASWGGSYLIYDGDICKRLCNATEQKKTDNGNKRPNAREEWLDVQARALFQAYSIISEIANRT